MRRLLFVFAMVLVFNPTFAKSSDSIMPDTIPSLGTVTVVPNPSYKTGSFHNLIFGSHWREIWSTPIEAPILDMQNFAGGLTAERKGGGFQTQSLRLKGKNGVVYKFRSIDKDPLKMVPKALQKSIVADILQDQISSYHPFSTVIVKPITRAVGVLYSEAQICVLPKDSVALGEFTDQFGGMLGTIEVHPNEHKNAQLSFKGADKVMGSHKFYEKLISDNDEQVDEIAYLKARLLDIFLGDWDRHYDQWRWAGFKKGKKRIWKPIPRDRDQAFARLEGIFPWIETQIIPQMNSFAESYPSIWFLTWSGRRVDRKCLTSLDKSTWDSVATQVQQSLSDSVISAAIAQLPKSVQTEKTRWLEKALKSRRNGLLEAAKDMYRIYAAYVDIDGSNDDDYCQIKRHSNGSVSVKLYKMDKKEWTKKGKPWYSRKFDPDYTHEIRVYLHDNDDKVVITGNANTSIPVRIIGGKGKDQFYDKSLVHCTGMFSTSKTFFYDSGPETYFKPGPNTSVNTNHVQIPPNLVDKYERTVRDYGNELWYSIDNLSASYSSDYGLFLGHGARLEHYAFRQSPYAYKMTVGGGYAFGGERYELMYHVDFRTIVPGASLTFDAKTSGLENLYFYGFGNNSSFDPKLEDDDFYESDVQTSLLSARLTVPFKSHALFYIGSDFKHLDIELRSDQNVSIDDQTFLNVFRPKGIRENQNLSLVAGLSIDTREKTALSTAQEAHLSFNLKTQSSPTTRTSACSGSYLTLEGRYFLNILKNPTDFSKLTLDMGTYIPLPFKLSRLALRFGGEKIWGPFPFFEAAYLGGQKNLRGFPFQRYAGDAEIHAGSELRLYLTKLKFFVPIYFGPLLFSETGRVFLDGESSANDWHTSVGCGFWLSFIEPIFTVSFSVGRTVSEPGDLNTTAFYLSSGFTF